MNEHDLLCEILETTEAFLDTEPIPTGPKAKELVVSLRAQIANLQQYRLYGNEADRPPAATKTKLCERCKTPFFFARDLMRVRSVKERNLDEEPWQHRQGWAPFELDTISAKGVTANYRYVIDFDGPYPTFRLEPTRDSGQVWVDHRQTCGTGDGPKFRCSPYLRRYKVNQERANLEVESWKDDLQALQRRLNRDQTDADT